MHAVLLACKVYEDGLAGNHPWHIREKDTEREGRSNIERIKQKH